VSKSWASVQELM